MFLNFISVCLSKILLFHLFYRKLSQEFLSWEWEEKETYLQSLKTLSAATRTSLGPRRKHSYHITFQNILHRARVFWWSGRGLCDQKEPGVHLPDPCSFSIFLWKAVEVRVQGCVQTSGLQMIPLSQEAGQVCPLTGPRDSSWLLV